MAPTRRGTRTPPPNTPSTGQAIPKTEITNQPWFQQMARSLGYNPNATTGAQYVDVFYHQDPNSEVVKQSLLHGGVKIQNGHIVATEPNWFARNPWVFAIPAMVAGGIVAGPKILTALSHLGHAAGPVANAATHTAADTAATTSSFAGIPASDWLLFGGDILAKSLAAHFSPPNFQRRASYSGTGADPVQFESGLNDKLNSIFDLAKTNVTTPARSQVDFGPSTPITPRPTYPFSGPQRQPFGTMPAPPPQPTSQMQAPPPPPNVYDMNQQPQGNPTQAAAALLLHALTGG